MKQCTGSLFISADGVLTMRTSISLSCAAGGGLGTALVPPRPLRLHRILHRLIAPALPGAFTHSITSLAVAISDGDTVRPSALAVLRLITSSNLVGCSTGKSAGLAPRSILSTNEAARRKFAGRLAP